MITPEQRREIKRLVNDIVQTQLVQAERPNSQAATRAATTAVGIMNRYLASITEKAA